MVFNFHLHIHIRLIYIQIKNDIQVKSSKVNIQASDLTGKIRLDISSTLLIKPFIS